MATDVRLDEGDGSFVVIDARVAKIAGSDLMLDFPANHTGPGSFRRALVHDGGDRLTVNFSGDYPGGVTVEGPLTVGISLVVRGNVEVQGGIKWHGGAGTTVEQKLPIPVPGGGPGTTVEKKLPIPTLAPLPQVTLDLNEELQKLKDAIRDLAARVTSLGG